MAMHYGDETRETEENALPNIEVWESETTEAECERGCIHSYPVAPESCCSCGAEIVEHSPKGRAWWWWSCFPGCLPDSEPFGPFETEAEALEDARRF